MRETDLGPGRPDADECLPYYFTYIDLVPDGHLMKLLERQISESASFLTAFTPEQALWREAPGERNVIEIVGRWPMPSASPRAPHRAPSRLACWAMSSPNTPVTPVPNTDRCPACKGRSSPPRCTGPGRRSTR